MKTRLSAVFALLIMMLTLQAVAQQVNYSSIDSADVYAHLRSGDPAYGTYLGEWGFNGVSVDPAGWPPTDGDRYAHGYVQWQLSGFTPGVQYHVTSAVMTVYQLKNPKWTNSNPDLELRTLGSNWSEASWVYSNTSNPVPGQLLAFGDRSVPVVDQHVPITFNLNSVDFENYLNSSVTGGVMSFALTTPMDPGGPTSGLFYTLRTRDYPDQTFAPKLVITAEVVPEPGTVGVLLAFGVLAAAYRRHKN
ncbi:MAG: hypothetical protein WCO51_06260 [bacterium]